MVESSGLLNRRRVKSSTGGSNPPLSAINNLHAFGSGACSLKIGLAARLLTKLRGCYRLSDDPRGAFESLAESRIGPLGRLLILAGYQPVH